MKSDENSTGEFSFETFSEMEKVGGKRENCMQKSQNFLKSSFIFAILTKTRTICRKVSCVNENSLNSMEFCPKMPNVVKISLKLSAKLSNFFRISYNLFPYFIVKLSKIPLSIEGGLPPSPDPLLQYGSKVFSKYFPPAPKSFMMNIG